MRKELRGRRDQAVKKHDAALARNPNREGATFTRTLQDVVNELHAVASAADIPSSDPVEVSKTYRWLGDAYFDLAQGEQSTKNKMLTQGAQAYRRSEELLADAETPVERAKLDFNYGNTLRALSEGTHVGLLEAAQTRYESAVRAFQTHHLSDLAGIAEQHLLLIEPQVRLARKRSELERGYGRLEQMKESLENASPQERERIEQELEDLKRVPGRGDIMGSLSEMLHATRMLHEQNPERMRSGDAAKIDSLQEQIGSFEGMLEEFAPEQSPANSEQCPEIAMLQALKERMKAEVDSGVVSADRSTQLEEVLKQVGQTIGEGGGDLASLSARAHRMRALMKLVMDAAMDPSWATPDPLPKSRAGQLLPMFESLKRHLLAETASSMLPAEEARAGTDLFERHIKLEARVRQAATDSGVAALEDELWRLASDVQEYHRRYHLILAQPDFAMARTHARPKSVFLAGGDALRDLAEAIAERDGLSLFAEAGRGDRAQSRWNQLCSASVGVFDVGVPEGPERAQVCYELGLALALGKPSVVVARPDQTLPFDVNLKPLYLAGSVEDRVGGLNQAIRGALGSIIWGGIDRGSNSASSEALSRLRQLLGTRLSDGIKRVALQSAEQSQDDMIAFRRSLDQLLGMLGGEAPAVLLPAWPPSYPSEGKELRCFHVMPFGPGWSKPTQSLAKRVCHRYGWIYSRGDEAEQQRIIRGIWSEIGSASAVLVDITDHNPNVSLELGLVHALGRPYRLIAQGDAKEHTFPSLEKVQIHSYGPSPHFAKLDDIIEGLLTSDVS